jgi:hypothetical protein
MPFYFVFTVIGGIEGGVTVKITGDIILRVDG